MAVESTKDNDKPKQRKPSRVSLARISEWFAKLERRLAELEQKVADAVSQDDVSKKPR